MSGSETSENDGNSFMHLRAWPLFMSSFFLADRDWTAVYFIYLKKMKFSLPFVYPLQSHLTVRVRIH